MPRPPGGGWCSPTPTRRSSRSPASPQMPVTPRGPRRSPHEMKRVPPASPSLHAAVIGQDAGMATHVALLRGINLGGRNKLPMTELRRIVESLGHTGVATYIHSGNVVFTTREPAGNLAGALAEAITAATGLKVGVIV